MLEVFIFQANNCCSLGWITLLEISDLRWGNDYQAAMLIADFNLKLPTLPPPDLVMGCHGYLDWLKKDFMVIQKYV